MNGYCFIRIYSSRGNEKLGSVASSLTIIRPFLKFIIFIFIDIFADFILQLLQQENELSQQEKKLIEEVDKNGTEPLNENQTDFLKNIVSRYSKKCEVCNEEIPLN